MSLLLISCLGCPSPSRLPLPALPLPDRGGTNSPMLTHRACLGRQQCKSPQTAPTEKAVFILFQDFLKQYRSPENSGNQRVIHKSIYLHFHPRCTTKNDKRGKNLEFELIQCHCLNTEYDNKWLNQSLNIKTPFTLILLLITFPCRVAISDYLSHLY